MYLGAIVLFFAHIFFGQHWAVAIGTAVSIVCCYLIILSGDQRNIEKFGDDYKRYMDNVPRTNFIQGIIRILKRRNKKRQNNRLFQGSDFMIFDPIPPSELGDVIVRDFAVGIFYTKIPFCFYGQMAHLIYLWIEEVQGCQKYRT